MNARDRYPVAECDNCGEGCAYESMEAHKLLTQGVSFDELTISDGEYVAVQSGFCLDLSGHYGGFADDMPGGKLARVILCHDCALAVARALPGIFKRGEGHHSMFYDEAHTSCCEFGWTSIESQVYVGDRKGGWVPVEER